MGIASVPARILRELGWIEVFRPRSSRPLAVNAFVDAAGTGTAAACLTFYLVRVQSLSLLQVAIVLTVLGAVEVITALPNGMLARRISVRRYLVLSKIVQGCLWIGLAVSFSPIPAVVILVAIGWMRGGAGGLNQSLTAAVVGSHNRSTMLGAVRSLRNVGYLASGPIVAVLLVGAGPVELRLALIINGVSFLVGAFCVFLTRPIVDANGTPAPRGISVLRDPLYLALIPLAAFFNLSADILDIGLPLWLITHPSLPNPLLAAIIILNTALVIAVQVRVSRYVETTRPALRGVAVGGVAIAACGVALAATDWVGQLAAIALFLVAGVALTVGEIAASPSWWTLSYELAPEGRRDEYLATFDLSSSVVALVGPAAIAAAVAAGALGWLAIAMVALIVVPLSLVLASAAKRRLPGDEPTVEGPSS